jgi:NADH-ubiquinone oxidoreductase chain 4L
LIIHLGIRDSPIFHQKNRTLLVLISSFGFDDNIGQTFGVYIIAIAGAESVIGLSILVAYYRLRGNISLRT